MSMVAIMAKKKSTSPKQPEPAPRRAVLQMKGTEDGKNGWMISRDIYACLHPPLWTTVLVMYAKAQGFTKEAPER